MSKSPWLETGLPALCGVTLLLVSSTSLTGCGGDGAVRTLADVEQFSGRVRIQSQSQTGRFELEGQLEFDRTAGSWTLSDAATDRVLTYSPSEGAQLLRDGTPQQLDPLATQRMVLMALVLQHDSAAQPAEATATGYRLTSGEQRLEIETEPRLGSD